MKYTVRELNLESHSDFEQLAHKQGGCWCMYYQREKPLKVHGKELSRINRKEKKALVKKGKSHAIIVYDGAKPVG